MKKVHIKCPECGKVQMANEKTENVIHHCEKCKYLIMESEWEEVDPIQKMVEKSVLPKQLSWKETKTKYKWLINQEKILFGDINFIP